MNVKALEIVYDVVCEASLMYVAATWGSEDAWDDTDVTLGRICKLGANVEGGGDYNSISAFWFSIKTNSVAQEPEGSSPYSQQPATGPYPEPDESNPHPPSQSL
jgi:hypothetical protein